MLLILIKAMIIYLLVVVCVRLTGKRQLGEMQPFELVVMLMLADLGCIPINDPYIPFYTGIVPIITLTFLSIIFSLIARKNLFVRRLISGKSMLVIDRGAIDYKNLKKLNLNMHDLIEAVSSNGYPDINTIEYAIFETNGKLSVVEKSKDPTKPAPALLPKTIIIDGKYNQNNLLLCGLRQVHVDAMLKKRGVMLREVLYMDIRQDGTGYVCPKNGEFFTENLKVRGAW